MSIRTEVCVIVDAYSTANKLAGAINAYGYPCVHVQSSQYIPNVLLRSFRPQDFIEHFICDKSPAALHREMVTRNYRIKCVITGAESGVVLGDFLADAFNVVGNGSEGSLARRNKFLMAEKLKANSLAHIKHLKTNNVDEIISWAEKNSLRKLVIKPLLSSGTYGFHICHDQSDIENAFADVYQNKDIFGNVNDVLLAQEYVEGQEYCINMVSFAGQHYVSEIWKTNKTLIKHSKVYDLETLLPEDHTDFKVLCDYAKKAMAALQINYGPSHSEIIIRNDGSPVLVEAAARFMGSVDLALVTKAYGTNPILLTAEAYLQNENFLQRVASVRPRMLHHPAMVQLVSHHEGILKEFSLNKLRDLKTFHGIDIFIKPGDSIKKTVNSYSSPGLVFLSGATCADIEKDYLAIRAMEKRGDIYVI